MLYPNPVISCTAPRLTDALIAALLSPHLIQFPVILERNIVLTLLLQCWHQGLLPASVVEPDSASDLGPLDVFMASHRANS